MRSWLNVFLDPRREFLVKQPSGFLRFTRLAKSRGPRILIGVRTRVLRFHYTLGMGWTAVSASALHQGLETRVAQILSSSIFFAPAAEARVNIEVSYCSFLTSFASPRGPANVTITSIISLTILSRWIFI